VIKEACGSSGGEIFLLRSSELGRSNFEVRHNDLEVLLVAIY
jgi:hypothetical protein